MVTLSHQQQWIKENSKQRINPLAWLISLIISLCLWALIFLIIGKVCFAQLAPAYSDTEIVNAIYHAEGTQSKHPYGIMKRYKHTTPRQACFNTVRSAKRRFAVQTKEKDFIVFLQKTYAPIGVKNDPKGLNQNWQRNVKFYLAKNRNDNRTTKRR